MYSAIKHEGVPLYRLARQGVEVERPPREVVLHRLDIKEWRPPCLVIDVEVGRGFYLRSLAHDLGEQLGSGAYLAGLVRLRSGPFRIDDAISLEELEDKLVKGRGQEVLEPLDAVVREWEAMILNDKQIQALQRGQPLYLPLPPSEAPRCRAYDSEGRLIALLRYKEDQGWRPFKQFFGVDQ
jgi:tRNA pseudouridine55 synthase